MNERPKKSLSPDDLKKFKMTEKGLKEKTQEEIEMEAKNQSKNTIKKNELDIEHSVNIPNDVYENIETRNRRIDLKARAPYNFVPLNDTIVPSEFNINNEPFDRYREKRNTGYIKLDILSKTPIYLRDLLEKEESDKVELLKSELEKFRTDSYKFKEKYLELLSLISNFYSPGDGIFKLSGSSLRGLIRTCVEIISYSRIGFIDENRKFHYRAMADMSIDLKKKFSNEMLDGNIETGFYQKVKAGYLVKDGTKYKIVPVDSPDPDCQIFRVEENTVISKSVLSDKMSEVNNNTREKNQHYKIGFKKIRFTFDPPTTHQHSQKLYYSKVNDIFNINDSNIPPGASEGVIIYSGWMPSSNIGKHLHWVIGPAAVNTKPIDFLPGVIEDYINDEGRDKEANLLDWFNKYDEDQIPCFYLVEGDKIKSFGHTGIFRLAYEQNLKDFIPYYHRERESIDIAEGIFGNETEFAGRVFFEDAKIVSSISENPLMNMNHPKILSNPKPTTFQHYLVQTEITAQYNRRKKFQGLRGLKDYNSTDVSIRGNKIYWHKNNNDWSASQSDIDNHLNQLTLIKCIDEGETFSGRIRFENLSDIELGALLFALDLPQECCHKIGMGKPLGLGSIRITPTLHLSNRENRYKELFNEWSSDLDEPIKTDKKIDDFKNAFATHIINCLIDDSKEHTVEELWKISRMEELKRMLDFDNKPDNDKTRYMKIEPRPNEFRNRPVLPKPSNVK